jgi:hypothetical protein
MRRGAGALGTTKAATPGFPSPAFVGIRKAKRVPVVTEKNAIRAR